MSSFREDVQGEWLGESEKFEVYPYLNKLLGEEKLERILRNNAWSRDRIKRGCYLRSQKKKEEVKSIRSVGEKDQMK